MDTNTRKTLTEYLSQYERASELVRSLTDSMTYYERQQLDRIGELRHSLILPSHVQDGMPRSGSSGDRMASVAAQIDEIERELGSRLLRDRDRIRDAKRIMQQIRKQVSRMPDNRNRKLIELRFIEGRTWFFIADELQTSEQNCRKRILDSALDEFRSVNRRSLLYLLTKVKS